MEYIQYEMLSVIGSIFIVASPTKLHGVYFRPQPIPVTPTLPKGVLSGKIIVKTAGQLAEYLVGKRKEFDIEIEFEGSDFQRKVWQQLVKIPYGKTASYRDIAAKIKNPKAFRAVGTANGRNPFCIIVPCHRVIAADGSIGGYAGGIAVKRRLLELEGSSE